MDFYDSLPTLNEWVFGHFHVVSVATWGVMALEKMNMKQEWALACL